MIAENYAGLSAAITSLEKALAYSSGAGSLSPDKSKSLANTQRGDLSPGIHGRVSEHVHDVPAGCGSGRATRLDVSYPEAMPSVKWRADMVAPVMLAISLSIRNRLSTVLPTNWSRHAR